jgi:vancomycin resistance protein YoaR
MSLFKKTVLLSLILLVQSVICIFGAAAFWESGYSGVIRQGITVNGIPVGGLTPAQAVRKLENNLSSPAEIKLQFTDAAAGKSHSVTLSEIDGKYDFPAITEEVIKYSKKSLDFNQLLSALTLMAAPPEISLKITYDHEKLKQNIALIGEAWKEQPQNATVKISEQKVLLVPEVNGYRLDFENTREKARLALTRGVFNIAASGRILKPDITVSDLQGVDTLLSEFTTAYDGNAENRVHNIALAGAAINGSVLKPEEIFSLNRQLGPRMEKSGYLKAPVIANNRLTLDFGGGICQVATTLYNAVLLAGLDIVERFPHSQPVNYIPPGLDATISGDHLDLKFANNTDTPVYIAGLSDATTFTVRIFGGDKNHRHTIRITSEKQLVAPRVTVMQDDTLQEGETKVINPGRTGYQVKVYREVLEEGRVVSKTLISEDYYRPTNKIIHVGPGTEELEK